MAEGASLRKLASIVAIDVAGYSRRTEADEEAAVKAIAALHQQVAKAAATHGGRVFNTAGDGFMLEFPSALSALAAAEEISAAGDPPVRAGVHLGDVTVTGGGDLLGHGVNVAARIQQMASPGAVLVSGDVKRAIRGPFADRLKPQGSVRLDKMSETLPVFALAPAEGGRTKGRRLDLRAAVAIAAGVVILALAGTSLWQARGAFMAGPSETPRTAIISFETASAGAAGRDLADGMTDQIVSVLNANGMPTLSHTAGAGPAAPAQSDAAFVLQGSVRSDGKLLTVTAHVDDARNRVVLWSGEIAKPVDHIAALRQEAAARVANVLVCGVTAREAGLGSGNSDTLSLIMRSCDEDSSIDFGHLEESIELNRKIVARAPHYARAHSNLAFILIYAGQWFPPGQAAELQGEARSEAEKALAIDRNDGYAYVDLADLLPPSERLQRETLLRRGVSVAPTSDLAYWSYSALLTEAGRLQDALVAAQKAVGLNSLSPTLLSSAVEGLVRVGQIDAADAALDRLRLGWPDAPETWGTSFSVAQWEGRFDVALSALEDKQRRPAFTEPQLAVWREFLLAMKSRDPKGRASARKSQIAFGDKGMADLAYSVANLAQLGFVDDAFTQAGKLGGRQTWITSTVLFDPSTAVMRRDPRFMALATKLGLVDYWRSTGKWPDFCAEPSLPYDCKVEAAKYAGGRHG